MKPPVDAPTSSATRPVGSIPKASSAAASLCPPRLTYGSGATTAIGVVRRRAGRRACGRGAPRRPPPPGPCRPARAPGRGCAISTSPRSTSSWSSRTRWPSARRSTRGSPAYRGTARCTRTHADDLPGGAGNAATAGMTHADHPADEPGGNRRAEQQRRRPGQVAQRQERQAVGEDDPGGRQDRGHPPSPAGRRPTDDEVHQQADQDDARGRAASGRSRTRRGRRRWPARPSRLRTAARSRRRRRPRSRAGPPAATPRRRRGPRSRSAAS